MLAKKPGTCAGLAALCLSFMTLDLAVAQNSQSQMSKTAIEYDLNSEAEEDSIKIDSLNSFDTLSSDQVPLGTAYQSDGDYYLGLQSVSGEVNETFGNTKMDFRVGVDLSYDQALSLIDGKVDIGFNFPAVRVDAGANYAKEISADRYTGTYNVYAAQKSKSQMILPSDDRGYLPTTAALDLAEAYPGARAENIGDHFVNGFSKSSHIVINMKMEYRNEVDKREIGGYLDVDWIGFVNVSGKLQLLDDEKKKSVKITISGYQSGGDPNHLLNIIPDGIMLCTLENPEPCFDLFSDAIKYLKTDYINQLSDLDNYNIAEPYLVPYQHGGPELQALVPQNGYGEVEFINKLIIKETTRRWIDELLIYRRAKNIQRYYASSFSQDQLLNLQTIESKSRKNVNLFADIVDYCNLNKEGDFCSDFESSSIQNYYQTYSDIESILN